MYFCTKIKKSRIKICVYAKKAVLLRCILSGSTYVLGKNIAKSGAKLQQKIRMCKKNVKNTSKSVKNHPTYGILLLALLFCGSVNARVQVNHYVGGYGQVGEWSLLPSQSNYSASLGVAGGAGFIYELQAGHTYSPVRFLFNVGVGATGGMTAYSQRVNQTEALLNQRDLQNEPFDYIYEIKDRQDRYTNVALHVPFMFGVQVKRFYALAGVKVYANIWTKAHSKATVTTLGRYADFDDFGENGWPEYQFFAGEPIQSDINTSLNLDMDLSVELGARLGEINYGVGYDVPKRKMEYRIAAFLDYGLLDIHTKGTKPSIVLPERYDIDPASPNYVYKTRTMVDKLVMNDIMSTNAFASMVNNLVVGVKFTVLFQLPEQQRCVLCQDAYFSTVRTYGRSRRGMNYEE